MECLDFNDAERKRLKAEKRRLEAEQRIIQSTSPLPSAGAESVGTDNGQVKSG